MKTIYIPKGETIRYESLATEHLVVHGCLQVTCGITAKTITGYGTVHAGTVNADVIRVDDMDAGSIVCKRLLAKRVQSPEVFASESAAVSCFLSSAYVETGKLTVTLSEIDTVNAAEIINLTPKKRTLFGTLLASAFRSIWTVLTVPMAGQLCRGMSGFNLMSTGYKPIYEVLSRFAAAFPTGQKTNAAVVGRLMNNIKLGYYPTDPDNISLMLRGIRFPDGVTTNLFDPCCGCGKALRQLAQGNNCYAYGVELDESRAEEAQTRLHRVGFGSFFYSRISHEAFHLLFLNPPYLSVINESGGRSRHEKRFLIESLPTLMYGGLLIYVIPYYRLTPDICRVLVDNFNDLSVWRFTDSEFKQFKQVAIFGVRKHRDNRTRKSTDQNKNPKRTVLHYAQPDEAVFQGSSARTGN